MTFKLSSFFFFFFKSWLNQNKYKLLNGGINDLKKNKVSYTFTQERQVFYIKTSDLNAPLVNVLFQGSREANQYSGKTQNCESMWEIIFLGQEVGQMNVSQSKESHASYLVPFTSILSGLEPLCL